MRFAWCCLLAACSTAPLDPTGTLEEEPFTSLIVEDDYLLRWRLPPGHDPDVAYPLIVQLDPTYAGLKQFEQTVGLVSSYGAAGEWPEAIVLGVDYPDPWTRHRDYQLPDPPDPEFDGAGADLFFAVLRDEILPLAREQYAIDPSRVFLLGHSNGGVFACYTLLRFGAGELPFTGVVAADFGVGTELFTYEGWLAERSDDLPLRAYASRAVFNGATQQITHEALFERLRGRGYPGLVLQTELLETDHGGAVVPSYERGLTHLFGGAP
jgi:hypothetical protein